jgi:CRISPR/Cas system-associated exonuclease Cas4 (RecB family)
MLMAATGERWTTSNEIIGRKRRLAVPIDDSVVTKMLAMARDLTSLVREDGPPAAERRSICASCSYRRLCWSP